MINKDVCACLVQSAAAEDVINRYVLKLKCTLQGNAISRILIDPGSTRTLVCRRFAERSLLDCVARPDVRLELENGQTEGIVGETRFFCSVTCGSDGNMVEGFDCKCPWELRRVAWC